MHSIHIKQSIHTKLTDYSADGETLQPFTMSGTYGSIREICCRHIRAHGVYRVNCIIVVLFSCYEYFGHVIIMLFLLCYFGHYSRSGFSRGLPEVYQKLYELHVRINWSFILPPSNTLLYSNGHAVTIPFFFNTESDAETGQISVTKSLISRERHVLSIRCNKNFNLNCLLICLAN